MEMNTIATADSQTAAASQSVWGTVLTVTGWVFALCMAYAIVRYNVFNAVPVKHIPLYILNKAVSLSSVLLFAWAFIAPLRAKLTKIDYDASLAKGMIVVASMLAVLHVVLTMIILEPGYFKKLYAIKRFNELGEITLMFGALSIFLLLVRVVGSLEISGLGKMISDKFSHWFNLLFSLMVMAHLFVMGGLMYSHKYYSIWPGGWIKPHIWPGMMPPISLLAFLALFTFCMLLLYVSFRKEND